MIRFNIGDTVIITNDDSPYFNLVGKIISKKFDELEVFLGKQYGWGRFESSELGYIC